MTTSVRILTTSTLDSSPAVLLVSADGSKILVNCGEGCQRSFLETSQKMSTLTAVCLTHLTHDSIGGLPGMILTTADISAAAIDNAKAAAAAVNHKKSTTTTNNSTTTTTTTTKTALSEGKPGLELYGPKGTNHFIQSLRHFMRRDRFELRVCEGKFTGKQPTTNSARNKANKKGKAPLNESFIVQSISCAIGNGRTGNELKRMKNENSIFTEFLSYIFTTPPIQGKFLIDKAKALGIPPGPLYGQLKSGKSVTFVDKNDGLEKTVHSEDVVLPSNPGITVAVLNYPTLAILEQLMLSETLNNIQQPTSNTKKDAPLLEVIVHMTRRDIFSSEKCQRWMQSFNSEVEHIFLETDIPLQRHLSEPLENWSPFQSALSGAISRSLLSPQIYESPMWNHQVVAPDDETSSKATTNDATRITKARPLLEYVLIPRAKRGFVNHGATDSFWNDLTAEATDEAAKSGAIEQSRQIIEKLPPLIEFTSLSGEILFTGTGSAIPCKHRNVSGIYLKMQNNNSILLDVGEGTTGQLLRAKSSDNDQYDQLLRNIKAIWISHPHADHHVGILRMLSTRKQLFENDPVVLIGPPSIFRFMEEYEAVDPTIIGSYIPLDCRDLTINSNERKQNIPAYTKLCEDLNVTSCISVPVTHCAHSFAIIIDGTPFGRVSYSGDCRPSSAFASAAFQTDVLIHEATFEEGMEAEAVLKRHSTVKEALEIGQQMQAKTVILTHFSQRYPRIPPARDNNDNENNGTFFQDVIFAFDFIKLTPNNLKHASQLTPALRLLYPDETTNTALEDDVAQLGEAQDVMAIPGLFAQKEIL